MAPFDAVWIYVTNPLYLLCSDSSKSMQIESSIVKFEEMYLRYFPILLVYGKTITPNEVIIEDTIQELFITLWRKRDRLGIKSSIDNYLFVSFRNNLHRKLKEMQLKKVAIDNRARTSETEQVGHHKEKQLTLLLQELPPRQREVIFLRYYQNKSYQEIAQILGIGYQVARNFSYRAIKSLKKKMILDPSKPIAQVS